MLIYSIVITIYEKRLNKRPPMLNVYLKQTEKSTSNSRNDERKQVKYQVSQTRNKFRMFCFVYELFLFFFSLVLVRDAQLINK